MKVLFATSEARPLVKTGGLADVSGALPPALRGDKIDCRLLLPGYPGVLHGVQGARQCLVFERLPIFGPTRLLLAKMPDSDTPVYVIDAPHYYGREGGPYQDTDGRDHADNALRFGLLSWLAAYLASGTSPLDWRPDVLHCNDWQTGLAPAWLRFMGGGAKSLMTIHNLAYQGIFPPETVGQLGLPAEHFHIAGLEYYGNLSFLKAGLFYADRLSTVSPSYAEEIQHEPLGMGLQGLLAGRREVLSGIVNGIDTAFWNPAADLHIGCSYSARNPAAKKNCKQALQEDLNLAVEAQAPVFGMISRLTHQKGLDLVLEMADWLVGQGGQMVFLGSGDAALEASLHELAARHPGRVASVIGYDEGLAHRIEAGADCFLMPSRFEPCGLNQMYSQRYGTPPIVHATGGLRDTVVDATPEALARGAATGFVFAEATAAALQAAVARALALYRDAAAWKRLQVAGMKRDFSWEKSAAEYAELYRGMVGKD
ncbi:starch synthase [Sulfuritortus calidifontis]|uniref:Glycogen synthase n=1 Tax=Sulfuritortus calidifontis TaxID=1914471 RepID=A0A4R3JWR8_9PROT|nr:glycogen synthase GlgA [Sulfuritortus calidifontis]TCS71672.1 starch synthase [Sulfuritortus calidifontis]